MPQFLCADLPGQAPTTINKPNTNPFPKQAPPPNQKEKSMGPHKFSKPPRVGVAKDYVPFTLPGIVGMAQGQWVGSDNLYNVRPDITIYVELVMPEDTKFEINDKEIKAKIQEIFTKSGINPTAVHYADEPSLPLFHVLIMLNSIDQCLTAFCACRLFEPVTLKRVIQEQGITFQAITWEKQDLMSATKKDFYPLLDKTIDNLALSFTERFHYFQNVRAQQGLR